MLLAFSAKREELDILMLSLTFGNVDVQRYASIFLSAILSHDLNVDLQTQRFANEKNPHN